MDYLAATPSEINDLKSEHPLKSKAAQDILFPHAGTVLVSEDAIEFSGFLVLTPGEVTRISQEYIDSYTRFMAAGSRGKFGSFGIFKNLGAPVVFYRGDQDPIVVLIDFTRWSGTTKNSDFLCELTRCNSWAEKIAG